MRYTFHITVGIEEYDEDALELPNSDAAKAVAVAYIVDMLRNAKRFLNDDSLSVEIREEGGTPIYRFQAAGIHLAPASGGP